MKSELESPSEVGMKFFTPELYRQFNSSDEVEAEQAEEAWMLALSNYKSHLETLQGVLPPHLKRLAEDLCLHDAELVVLGEAFAGPEFEYWFKPPDGFDSVRKAASYLDRKLPAFPLCLILVRQGTSYRHLLYSLSNPISRTEQAEKWPFAPNLSKTCWLYDEFDLSRTGKNEYLHRVLLSDGTCLSIPFVDVTVLSFYGTGP